MAVILSKETLGTGVVRFWIDAPGSRASGVPDSS